jgi:5'-3' exonuclease
MTPDQKRIFDSLVEKKLEVPNINDRILLIDSMNTFIRSFTVIKHVNRYAVPIGGLTGFLKSLAHAIKVVRPTRVLLVFDGEGSTTNKKYIYPEYKANRKIRRITNWDAYSNQEDETESMTNQLVRLVDYLKCLPVDIISLPKVEADDIIGYICQKFDKEVTIMSSDRDYLQLVSSNISVYSPIKKVFYTPELVKKEYFVTAQNFLTQKILLGDEGDNIPGVYGMGPKKLIKLFPELSETTKVSLEEVLEKSQSGKDKLHAKVVAFKHQLFINRQLMDLHNPNIPEDILREVHRILENPKKELDVKTFSQLYAEDTLDDSIPNLASWLYTHYNELSKYK